MAITAAKDRAEELWQTLQTRSREFLEAEEGLIKTIREMIETKEFNSADVRKALEEVLGNIKAHKVWTKVSNTSAVVVLSDYRTELEKKADEAVTRLKASFQIASTSEVEALDKKLKSLNRKVNEVNRKVKALSEA